MAEIVYKKISELDNGTVPLDGGELIMVSQTGVSKKATISQAHGAGWWNVLKVALSSFVAPNATHAVDSDTCGEESPSDFHDAAQLTGNIHLDRIPTDLTGKNAEANGGNSDTVDTYHAGIGDGKLNPVHGKYHGTRTGAQIYALLDSYIPNLNDWMPIHGSIIDRSDASFNKIHIASYAQRTFATTITIYTSMSMYNKSTNQWFTVQLTSDLGFTSTGSNSVDVSIVY